MKIAFLCSSLEPGRDGVGDYTRRLAGELIRQGHLCVAIALNDTHLSQMSFAFQEIEGTVVSVLRLPSGIAWNQRLVKAREWLARFNPEWISLQFVPFGFHPKGLCFGLGKSLAGLNSHAVWHVMFHELWVGLAVNSPFKHRIWGRLQKGIVLDLIQRIRPKSVHTQAEPYRLTLARSKIHANLLPLFSNIPRVNKDGWTELLEPLVTQATGKQPDRKQLYLVGVLGGVHPEWDSEKVIRTILPLAAQYQKRLVLVFIGKNNLPPEAFQEITRATKNCADVIATGERSNVDISSILLGLDLGVATSPRQMIQKSGSVAAMLEHGLPVLVTRDDWHLGGQDIPKVESSAQLLSPEQFSRLTILPSRDIQAPEESRIKWVAEQWIASMRATATAKTDN